jgi:hypothetical protein
MAWELQSQYHQYIPPSIYKAAEAEDDPHQWLANVYADQHWDEDHGADAYDRRVDKALDLPQDVLINAITDFAIEHVSATTNGSWEVYLDRGYWISVPWCTEDELQEWWG